jgi:predicted RNase H-like HicB family nuclease
LVKAENCAIISIKMALETPMLLTAVLIPAAEGGFTALNPETGTTTQGESVEEALANLREATELYLEEFPLTTSGQPLITTFQVAVDA